MLAIAVQTDGKVLIVGGFARVAISNLSWTNLNCIARLNTNGAVDGTFNTGQVQTVPCLHLACRSMAKSSWEVILQA